MDISLLKLSYNLIKLFNCNWLNGPQNRLKNLLFLE